MADWRLLLAIFIIGAIFISFGLWKWGDIAGYVSIIVGCAIIIADFALAFKGG